MAEFDTSSHLHPCAAKCGRRILCIDVRAADCPIGPEWKCPACEFVELDKELSAHHARQREARPEAVSSEPTPYVLTCPVHHRVFLTEIEYDRQRQVVEVGWECPLCTEHRDGIYFDVER